MAELLSHSARFVVGMRAKKMRYHMGRSIDKHNKSEIARLTLSCKLYLSTKMADAQNNTCSGVDLARVFRSSVLVIQNHALLFWRQRFLCFAHFLRSTCKLYIITFDLLIFIRKTGTDNNLKVTRCVKPIDTHTKKMRSGAIWLSGKCQIAKLTQVEKMFQQQRCQRRVSSE